MTCLEPTRVCAAVQGQRRHAGGAEGGAQRPRQPLSGEPRAEPVVYPPKSQTDSCRGGPPSPSAVATGKRSSHCGLGVGFTSPSDSRASCFGRLQLAPCCIILQVAEEPYGFQLRIVRTRLANIVVWGWSINACQLYISGKCMAHGTSAIC